MLSDSASTRHFHHLRKDFLNEENVLDCFRHLKFQKYIIKISKVYKKIHSKSI